MVDFGRAVFALRVGLGFRIEQKSLSARRTSGERRRAFPRSSHERSGSEVGDSSVAGMLSMVELLGADALGPRINLILGSNRFLLSLDFVNCRGRDLFRWRM